MRLARAAEMVFAFCVAGTLLGGEVRYPVREQVLADMDRRVKACLPFDGKRLSRFVDYPPSETVANSTFLSEVFASPFKPNPDFWLKDVDFSCASPWNSGAGRLRAGTAISPRHVVFSKHFALWKDVRIVFVAQDGTPSAYYIDKVRELPDCDITIGLLDAELVPNIRPAKVLPPDFLTQLEKMGGLPVVTLNQFERAILSEMRPTYTNSPSYQLDDFSAPRESERQPFHADIHKGDSGSPTFLLCGNEPVLLFCQTTTIGGYGLHRFRREVQSAMDALCPGYKLECLDLGE